MNKIWTLEEEQILCKYYFREGAKGIHKRMPYRTLGSINGKAYRMSIRLKKSLRKPWTTQELNSLKQFNPITGIDCHKRLPNRTKQAVQARTEIASLTKKKQLTWSKKELDILKNNLGTTNNIGLRKKKLQKLLPNRTWQAIKGKISVLEMRGEIVPPKRYLSWTPEEVAILRQYFPTEGTRCQKRLPNRSKSAIQSYAQGMGIGKLSRAWSVEENEILRKNSQLTIKALEKLLQGRAGVAIANQKSRLGLAKRTTQLWSREEDAILRRYYPMEGLACEKRLPNRTREGVIYRAARLAIKQSKIEKAIIRRANLNMRPKTHWSRLEIDIIRKNLDLERKALQKLLPNRTAAAIQLKRKQIRNQLRTQGKLPPLPHQKRQYWSSDEDAILRRYYPTEGTDCKKHLPVRTRESIKRRAQVLGVKCQVEWSQKELKILRENLYTSSKALQKFLPGRTISAIGTKKTYLDRKRGS